MAIQMSLPCSRCHRPDVIELNDFKEATALEDLQKQKADVLQKLQDFVKSLPQDALPDFFAVIGDKVIVHSYLCDPKDEKKRSCAKHVGKLLDEVTEREKRKPRSKKAGAAEEADGAAPAATTPPPPKASAPAAAAAAK